MKNSDQYPGDKVHQRMFCEKRNDRSIVIYMTVIIYNDRQAMQTSVIGIVINIKRITYLEKRKWLLFESKNEYEDEYVE